jgi:hypothetical protein
MTDDSLKPVDRFDGTVANDRVRRVCADVFG